MSGGREGGRLEMSEAVPLKSFENSSCTRPLFQNMKKGFMELYLNFVVLEFRHYLSDRPENK